MAAKLPERNTRVSIACIACRARKHRCSGEKPRCAQCSANDLSCEWPIQQKRGPPKQYIHSLEARLSQTENVLLALLSQVSAQQLDASFQQPPLSGNHDSGSLEYRAEFNSESSSMVRKEVLDWKQFPLDSPENVRHWWQHKLLLVPGPLFRENTGDDDAMLTKEKTSDMVPPTAPPLLHDPRDESGAAFSFSSDTGPQPFEVEASAAEISHISFEAENENETYYARRMGDEVDRLPDITSQSVTGAEGVLKLSEKFKQDYVW
ncbi:hypothetical protein BKA66DRAFT_473253 [Pyrenochaeta sp. MPI-SDFR-AT-0127]|nr:hypothetical protein BKA66DRAFT_473253 [Pyrenochaeta sp. MPI-SDFR-AT-0127]